MLGSRAWLCCVAWALVLAAGCDSSGEAACSTCGRTDAGDAAVRDGASAPQPDAAGAVDAEADAGDAVATDTAVPDDAAPPPDGAMLDAEPTYVECTAKEDCVLPEGVLACQRCADGSMACPALSCADRLCVFSVPKPCAEQDTRATCSSDDECYGSKCDLLCQGDGRNACKKSRCSEGRCVSSYDTCGLHQSRCPDGTRAGQECAECGDGGVCNMRVLGCFDACKSAQDCPGEVPCVDGLCRLLVCE
jgi:hypothetical protein